jgi:3-oxoacyl-(acyl-carrier-protein) synthase
MTDVSIVISGIGMAVPLGMSPGDVLEKLTRGQTARQKSVFNAHAFDCPFYAAIPDFDAETFFPENKTLRLMNRDAQLAAVAAQMAMQDAGIVADHTYPGHEIALYGATGVAGMSMEEAGSIVQHAIDENGNFNVQRFGAVALKRIRPVLSFKILASMPICFVSIFHNVRGPNAIYSPWEGNGAHAIAAGIRAIKRGDVPCALVGGCDVKTRELSLINLQQLGIFDSWKHNGTGCVPGEGSVFMVLEDQTRAAARGKKVYAKLTDCSLYSSDTGSTPDMLSKAITAILPEQNSVHMISACDGSGIAAGIEQQALASCGIKSTATIQPKAGLGDLFAAAAFVQVGLGAALARKLAPASPILANCMGHGSERAVFALESV